MKEIWYKENYSIETASYQLTSGKWLPFALVSLHAGGSIHIKKVRAPKNVAFDARGKADKYALAMAKKWVDERG